MIKIIENDGWYLVTTNRVIASINIPGSPAGLPSRGHQTDDLAPGTMNSIFKQANIKER
jgi:hypothetical protein